MPTGYEYAFFANDVYSTGSAKLPSNWRYLITSSTTSSKTINGYYAAVYIKDSTKECIIAHRGTVPSDASNLLSDLQLALGQVPTSFTGQVWPFVQHTLTLIPAGYSVSMTGHSLGAAYAVLSGDMLKKGGQHVPVVVFDLPKPDSVTDLSFVKIYNAAPHLINTLGPVGEVTRLFPDYGKLNPLLMAATPDVVSYATFSLQQHSMQNLLAQFNPVTGQPKISAAVSAWPYGTAATSLISYTGYADYTSYNLNPYYWEHELTLSWLLPQWVKNFPTYQGFRHKILQFLDPATPRTGKTLIGDDSGSTFFGGTLYADTYTGGAGDDTYYLLGGDDVVTDSGGSNTYVLRTPISGQAQIRDSNPSKAKITTMDGATIAGDVLPITSQSSSSRHLSDTINVMNSYIVCDRNTGKYFIAAMDENNDLLIGETFTSMIAGNQVVITNYKFPQYGLSKPSFVPPSANIMGVTDITQVTRGQFVNFIESASVGSKIIVAYLSATKSGSSSANSLYEVDINNARSITVGIIPFSLASIPASGNYIIQTAALLGTTASNVMRIYDINGKEVCNVPLAQNIIILSSTNDGTNFIFVSYDITSGTVPTTPPPLYLYKVASDCSISKSDLQYNKQSFYIPTGVISNQDLIAVTFYKNTKWALTGSVNADISINFYSKQLSPISNFNLPNLAIVAPQFAKAMNMNGDVATMHDSYYDANIISYLCIYNTQGLIKTKILKSGWLTMYDILHSNSQVTWLDNEHLVVIRAKGNSLYDPLVSIIGEIYDRDLTLVKSIFRESIPISTNNPSPYSYTASCAVLKNSDGNSGTIVFTWAETESPTSSTQQTLKSTFVRYSIETTPDVIVGTSEASDIDCSPSTASTCYAFSQEGDGDVLQASADQSAILVGNMLGRKTFKFGRPTRRMLTEDGESDSMPTPDIFGMKEGDAIDVSDLTTEEVTIIDNGNYSLLTSKFGTIKVYRAPDSTPFNLTFDAAGHITTMNSSQGLLPCRSSNAACSGGGGMGPAIAGVALSAGAIAGITIGVIAAVGLVGYGCYKGYQYIKKWWYQEDNVENIRAVEEVNEEEICQADTVEKGGTGIHHDPHYISEIFGAVTPETPLPPEILGATIELRNYG